MLHKVDNVSSSPITTVLPYDSGLRGDVQDLTVEVIYQPTGDFSLPPGYELLEQTLELMEETQEISILQLDTLYNIYNLFTEEEIRYLHDTNFENAFEFLKEYLLSLSLENQVARIRLSWLYPADDQLQDFQIYRSAPGSALMLYRTLTPADLDGNWNWTDEDTLLTGRYRYKLMARHRDGGFSSWSPLVMARVD